MNARSKEQQEARDFYVYLHRRATDGSIFYVGKGAGVRATKSIGRNPHWKNIVAKHGLVVEYAYRNLQEWYALELEKDLIALYGIERLANKTTGGDGLYTTQFTEDAKRRMSIAASNRIRSPMSEETKKKIGDRHRGRVHSEETRQKNRVGHLGRRHTEASKAKLAITSSRNRHTPEARESIRLKLMKPVKCSNGMVFASQHEAAEWVRGQTKHKKANNKRISAVCTNVSRSAYGLSWRFVDGQ